MPGDEPAPGDLLHVADRLLSGRIQHAPGAWPRPVAFLTRLALEHAVDAVLTRHDQGLGSVTWRAKLLCLPRYVDAKVAARTAYLWHILSAAGHYHAYELAPTANELRGWYAEAADLIEIMDARPADPGPAGGA